MVDMTRTIAPKSDQLNADDLIGGPRDIVVTEVRDMGGVDQPIAIFFDGDGGKPYKPCKSMRRALVFAWGPDGSEYVGRSMRLFLDPEVTWGGEKVGGIRISHMSHINGPQEFPLTATRGRRALYRVEPMPSARPRKSAGEHVDDYVARVSSTESMSDLLEAIAGAERLREVLKKNDATDLLDRMAEAERQQRAKLDPPTDELDDDGSAEDGLDLEGDDGFPDMEGGA